MDQRFAVQDLVAFARTMLEAAGFDGEKADVTARRLVEADMMGHTTHGLQLLGGYIGDARAGKMQTTGEPEILAERAAVVTWDGGYRPGVWLTDKGLGVAMAKARDCGQGTVVIRRSHHIACLATFLPKATEAGMMAVIASSDPATGSVAPYGGRKPLYTPNPIAVGIPTGGDPILIDISASITTNGMSGRLAKAGKRMPFACYLDAEGNLTDDPRVIDADPPGSILPLGGLEYGHKGYGLGLMIEAMTQALPGFGRLDQPTTWGAGVFIQAFDPSAFAGDDAFKRQTDGLVEACHKNPPRPGVERVRLPGEAALGRMREAREKGVVLHPGIMDGLAPLAAELGVQTPTPKA